MVRLDKFRFISLMAVVIIILDQLTKFIIKSALTLGDSIPIINSIFHLTYVRNTGAGFGILTGQNLFLILISILALGIIIYFWKEIPNRWFNQFLIGLITGGLIGNLIDRIFLGHVVDMFDFRIWPVFNIADSAITLGVIGLVLYELIQKRKS